MSNTIVNMCCPSNATFRKVFYVLGPDGNVRSDLSLSRLIMHVKSDPADVAIKMMAGNDPEIGGLQFLAPVERGLFVIYFPVQKIKDVGPGIFYQDLLEITPYGFSNPLWSGQFIIGQGVTNG